MLPEATVREMLSWPHGGFSLDGGTFVEARDRAGLERLLLYVLRPALSLKQLTYKPGQDLVVYRPAKGKPDSPAVRSISSNAFWLPHWSIVSVNNRRVIPRQVLSLSNSPVQNSRPTAGRLLYRPSFVVGAFGEAVRRSRLGSGF